MRRAGLVAFVLLALLAPPAEAAFPGKNGKIAFVQSGDIWTIRPDGTDLERVTRHSAPEGEPVWSPSGRWIAFTRQVGEGAAVIYRIRPDGSDLHRIVGGRRWASSPSWSPTGKWVAFSRSNGVHRARLDGADERTVVLHSGDLGYHQPAWHPRGRWIALRQVDPDGDSISLVRPGGRGLHVLRSFPGNVLWPAWRPFGRRLAVYMDEFVCDVASPGTCTLEGSLATFPPDREERRLVPIAPFPGGGPAYSPDGRFIVFEAGSEISIVRKDGKEVHPLVSGSDPDWQPLRR